MFRKNCKIDEYNIKWNNLYCSVAFPLPELNADGCRVTFHRINATGSNDIDVKAVVKYLLMIGEIRLIEEGPIAGDVCIFDVSGATAAMVSKLINPVVKKGIMCSQVRFHAFTYSSCWSYK